MIATRYLSIAVVLGFVVGQAHSAPDKVPEIPTEQRLQLWRARASYFQVQAAFQATLSEEQRRLLKQLNDSADALRAAEDAVRKTCGDQAEPLFDMKSDVRCIGRENPPNASH
jgi:hypothetical protein